MNIKVEAEECKPKETNMQTTTIPTESGGCQGVQYQSASAMLPTHSHSGTEDCLKNNVLSLIAMNYLQPMQLESSEDHTEFMDYIKMRVTIEGVSLLFGLFRLVLVNPGIQGFQVYNYCKCSFK